MITNKSVERPTLSHPTQLGKVIATGGEGVIRECLSHPGCVAKIYHPLEEEDLSQIESKIGAMLKMTQLAQHSRLAWPQKKLYQNRKFAGFLMRKIDGMTLVPLSAEVSKRTYLPDWTTAHIARVVHDIASLCAKLESHDVFLTDVSLTNFLTNPRDGSTSIIDVDSLQIREGSRVFGSSVFTPDYAAPEILRQPERLGCIGSEQARFTIALLFFQLYTNGSPFQVLEYGNLEPAQQITAGRHFLGGRGVATGTTTPEIFRRYCGLPRRIKWMFKRAFIEGHQSPSNRPSFNEWVEAAKRHYQELRG